MKIPSVTLEPEGRWHIPFSDYGYWRTGVYAPEFRSPAEITVLEKHTCPELFICASGRAGLLVKKGSEEITVELARGDAVLVEDYHNGYLLEEGSFFIVVERTSFATEYVDRVSGAVIKTVTVG